jgi:site-specific DNA recombinase
VGVTTTAVRPAAPTTGAAVPFSYERISRFRVDRDGVSAEVTRGVVRQAKDNGSTSVAMFGAPVAAHFTDEDRSASQYATKVRGAWLDLLERVRAGEATHVLVWLFDRAFRTTEAAEALLDACRQGGALIVQTAGSPVVCDPHNPDDIFRMKLAGLLAEYEVAKMAMRQRRSKLAAGQAGHPHGGRRRFGYTPEWEEHPTEGPVVRELVSRFLAGESLYKLAQWLNTEGIKGTSGGTWTGPNLRHLLKGPHLAGLRRHHGTVVDGTWDGLIPVEAHHHVVAMLSKPERRTNGTGTNARKYLLAGLGVCDECSEPLRGRPATARGEAPIYRCPSGRHVQRKIEHVDALVEAAMVERLARFDPAANVLVDDEASAELARLTEARAAMDAEYADLDAERRAGNLTVRAYAMATSSLEADMEATDAATKLAAAEVRQAGRVLSGGMGEGAAEAWAGWSLARKRAAIGELAEVRLRGGRRGTYSWNPDTDVVINWRP